MFLFNAEYIKPKDLNSLDGENIKAVLRTLEFLIQHEWNDITTRTVKKYHLVPLSSCDKAIANHHSECAENISGIPAKSLISFNYTDKGRILGLRSENTFYITYIDAKHKYCP